METISSFDYGRHGSMTIVYFRDILYWKIIEGVLYCPMSVTGVAIEGTWFKEHYTQWLEYKQNQLNHEQQKDT